MPVLYKNYKHLFIYKKEKEQIFIIYEIKTRNILFEFFLDKSFGSEKLFGKKFFSNF